MTNWDADVAQAYHEATKHTFASVRSGGRRLDWENRPHPFKEYVALDAVPLPEGDLAWLLRWGAGVIRTRTVPSGDGYHFRTYSSAGALYPVEAYLACAARSGLDAGLYHFHPLELALRPLRRGDVRAHLADATAESKLAEADAVVILTGILSRTAWKYGARGYRHLWWDAGTMLANLLALAEASALDARLYTGFVDADVNSLVGVDGRRERALALLAVGRAAPAPPARPFAPVEVEVRPLSAREVPYPEADAVHEASRLASADEVRRYRGEAGAPGGERFAAQLGLDRARLEDAIRRRGSVRDFAPPAVSRAELAVLLAAAAAPIRPDFRPAAELYLIANAVDGLVPGAYRFSPPDEFELLKSGAFRREAAYLCLEQPLGGLAAATHFLLADLGRVLTERGNRGYRAAQLEAGIRAGRIYLGAYAKRLAATASTFYDDDVTEFFAPGSAKAPLLAVAVGRR